MGLYAIECPTCKISYMWFSGSGTDQRCAECREQAEIDEFIEENKDLMQDLEKLEEEEKDDERQES